MWYPVGTYIDLSFINKEHKASGVKKSAPAKFEAQFEKAERLIPVGTRFKVVNTDGVMRLSRVVPVAFA